MKKNILNRFLLNQINNKDIIQTMNIDLIKFLELIKYGVEDSSLNTNLLKECSELLPLLSNI